jgi:ATP-binding cassette, subfamily B, bacterial
VSTTNTVESWRGVAAEDVDEVTGTLAGLLRDRSRRLLLSLVRPHQRSLLWAMLLILGYNAASTAGPLLVGLGIDHGIRALQEDDGATTLFLVVGALAVAITLECVTDNLFQRVTGRIGQDILFDLRNRLFDKFQRLSLAFHEKYTSGRVISRLTSDIEAIQEMLTYGLQSLVWAVLTLVTIAVLMLLLDVPLAFIGLLSFPVIVAVTVWFRANSAKAYRASREAVALVIVHFVESLGGIRAVQAFRREPRNQEIFEAVNGQYKAANLWSFRLVAIYGPGVRTLGHVATAAVLFVGANRLLDGQVTVGVLVTMLLYLRHFFEPVQELAQFYNAFQAASAALEKLSGVLEEELSVPEPDEPERPAQWRGELRFEGVRFGYRERTVIPGLDLLVPAGQTIALVGETGAGKTTVARLISRFYDPREGRILLDGIDLRSIGSDDLHRAVVTVTQESFLFSGTIADNIAFGRPDASRPDIEEAAKAIGAHDFIAALPEGYDTDVRKRGGRLSAGQRQLVSFARAFLADPVVLVLDEATSSLDLPSERLVQRALRTLLADRTAVIIAHRLSTVEIADRVLVIDDGRIVEDGSPANLMAGSGRYSALHQAWLDSLV